MQQKDLRRLVDLVVAEDAALPKAEFDPAALVAAQARDPQKLYEWVRDRTWWAPYRGLLRGAKGVMLDRVGSSLDRAVLLGDLLRRAGRNVRLAHSELSETSARELLSKVRPIPDQRMTQPSPTPSTQSQRSADAIVPGFTSAFQRLVAEFKRRTNEGTALARSQTDLLYSAVKNGPIKSGKATDESDLASLRDHWWVEYEDTGRWIAMDVLTPDAKPGDSVAKGARRSEWNADSEFPSIPDSDWHSVRIRLVIERYLAGTTTESTILETTLRPAQVFDKPVSLVHFPKPWPDGPVTANSLDALKAAALNVRIWTPILRVGDSYIAQSGFTESGDVKAHPFDPTADLGGGGLFGGLDSALAGGEASEPYASAEWIDYGIHVPGRPDQQVRRPLFDLLGPGRRLAKDPNFNASGDDRRLERSEVLLSLMDFLLQPAEFSQDFVTHLQLASTVAQQEAIRALSSEGDSAARKSKASAIVEGMHPWGPLLGYATTRFSIGDHRRDSFIGRTNITSYRVGFRLGAAGPPAFTHLIDVVANPIDVRRGATKEPFLVRMEQGVADTVSEVISLTGDIDEAANTAAIFDMVDVEPPGKLIAPHDAAAIGQLSWPEDETARLGEDSNAGFMSYAMRQPVELSGIQRVGWWRVDPATGETVGVMDSGFHAGTVEQTLTRNRSSELAARFSASPGAASAMDKVVIGGTYLAMGTGIAVMVACAAYDLATWGNENKNCNPWIGIDVPPYHPPPPGHAHGPSPKHRRHR